MSTPKEFSRLENQEPVVGGRKMRGVTRIVHVVRFLGWRKDGLHLPGRTRRPASNGGRPHSAGSPGGAGQVTVDVCCPFLRKLASESAPSRQWRRPAAASSRGSEEVRISTRRCAGVLVVSGRTDPAPCRRCKERSTRRHPTTPGGSKENWCASPCGRASFRTRGLSDTAVQTSRAENRGSGAVGHSRRGSKTPSRGRNESRRPGNRNSVEEMFLG